MNEKKDFHPPDMKAQRLMMLEKDTETAVSTLKSNLLAGEFPKAEGVDYSAIDARIFLTLEEGWVAPDHELVNAWFIQVKDNFSDYRSDAKLGNLLGLRGGAADRRIRAYRNGDEAVPYGIWRTFLELTGRVVPDIKPVLGLFDMKSGT